MKFLDLLKKVAESIEDDTNDSVSLVELKDIALSAIAELKEENKQLDNSLLEEIESRDHWEEKATNLANKVGEYFKQDVGEHSSANCPIRNAHLLLDALRFDSVGIANQAFTLIRNLCTDQKVKELAEALHNLPSDGNNFLTDMSVENVASLIQKYPQFGSLRDFIPVDADKGKSTSNRRKTTAEE